MEYLTADGTLAAHYEYSPFGEIVVQSGDMADSFTHRFSTKPWCGVTGLSEYLFRKYSPGLGRWLSRDPIGEVNAGLYPFCANSTLTSVDTMGLWGRSGHQEMVEAAAHDLDIPECIVSDIVSGVRGADTWHNPVLPWVGIITEPMPDLHTDDPATPDDDRLTTAQSLISEAKELFRKSCEKGSADQREEALRKLGWALHAIQDFYAHGSLPRGSRHPDWFDDTAVSPLPGSILPSEEYFRNQEGALYPWANDRSAAAVGATWDALFGFFSPDQACECGCQ
jgi:RHS repeat-associated protein